MEAIGVGGGCPQTRGLFHVVNFEGGSVQN